VLAEIAGIVKDEGVDLVLVAGDIFDHQSPSAAAEQIVYEALHGIVKAGAQVVMIAGNHDNAERLEAIRPFLELGGVFAGGKLKRPEAGGCLTVKSRKGEAAQIALLPWPSRSKIVTADELMAKEREAHQQKYKERCRDILQWLCAAFDDSAIHLGMAHLVITGAMLGGGERTSETIEEYWVDPSDLRVGADYIALGHIHKPQTLELMGQQVWYSGSPLQLDFGEEHDVKSVLVFDAKAGSTVRTPETIKLSSGRRMLTARGTLASLEARKGDFGDAYLRVVLEETARPGLADEVRELLPNAVEVRIESAAGAGSPLASRRGMQPHDLLVSYFEHVRVNDDAALKMFDDLVEQENAPASA
jgi:exonuclease SbcD